MKTYHTDLLIVGAGPAGCFLAKSVKDLDIILVERNRLPRDKPHSGLLVEESKDLLYPIGVPKGVFITPSELSLEHVDVDNNLDIVQKKVLGNTDHIKFDHWLTKLIGEDTNLMENTSITKIEQLGTDVKVYVVKDEEEAVIIARKLVGADGVTSTVRRLLGIKPLKRYNTVQNFVKTEKEIQNCEFIYWNDLTDWYSWIVPKDDGIVEVGGAFGPDINKDIALDRLMRKMAIEGKIVSKKVWLLSKLSEIGEIYLGNGKNIFLIGEAAGLISPSTGEGISFGLRSGLILSEALHSERPFYEYTRKMLPLLDELESKILKSNILSDPEQRKRFLNSLK